MKTVLFGNLAVGEIHRITGVIHMQSDLQKISSFIDDKVVDILEFRADRIYEEGGEAIDDLLRRVKEFNLPVIATVREDEGYNFTPEERIQIFEKLIPYADAVDIELKTEIRDKVIKTAKNSNKSVIVSEHNLKETPSDTGIKKILSESINCGADIAKIALYANSAEDVLRLTHFTLKNAVRTPLICLSLGNTGTISRFINPAIGSCMSYGYIDKPAAPGQSSLILLNEELKAYIKNLHQR